MTASSRPRQRRRRPSRVAAAVLGRDRRAALRPRLPARLPADRQPARRRGPHPGGLRPGVPLAVVVHARHLRGLAAPDHHEPVPRPGPPQGQDPLRRAAPTTPRPAPEPGAHARRAGARRRCSTTTSRRRWPRCRRTSGPPSCSATSRASPTRRSPTSLGLKLGTVRSRIHRGRAMLRKALAHRAPAAGRSRYSGPAEPAAARLAPQATDGGRCCALGGHLGCPVQRARRRPARRGGGRARLGRTCWHCPPCRAPGRARGLGQAPASPRSPAPRAPDEPSDRLLGSLLDLDPEAASPRPGHAGDSSTAAGGRRRAGIALVGAGSVSAAASAST